MSEENVNRNYLKVFEDKSEYHSSGRVEVFKEGPISDESKKRYANIKKAFKDGFLPLVIEELLKGRASIKHEDISRVAMEAVDNLICSLTSEVGRALIGLSVMQLSIKTISPEQNIRLHKGGAASSNFSWEEGISMRVLDKNFVTPVLRQFDLLKLNADGFMMTRSLAENYPYTNLYKAKIRGAKDSWLALTDDIEKGCSCSHNTLLYLLSKLINDAEGFKKLVEELFADFNEKKELFKNKNQVVSLIQKHIDESNYAARLLEVGMHSLVYSACELNAFGPGEVVPLSQMRSANKKHGNIGDVEVKEDGDIITAWDAKYGKGYLREEIEEIAEKARHHNSLQNIGFVITVPLERESEIYQRIDEISDAEQINITITSFVDWVESIFEMVSKIDVPHEILSLLWMENYIGHLGQRNKHIAPIDEPSTIWVKDLLSLLRSL